MKNKINLMVLNLVYTHKNHLQNHLNKKTKNIYNYLRMLLSQLKSNIRYHQSHSEGCLDFAPKSSFYSKYCPHGPYMFF